jgi:hypothetical protein
MSDSTTSSSKALFQFIGQPFSFYFGITAITSILFLDNYLLLNGSSVQCLSKEEYSNLGQVLIFFMFYFLSLHILAPGLRWFIFAFLFSLIYTIYKWRGTNFMLLVSQPQNLTDKDFKSQSSVHAEAIEEKNSVNIIFTPSMLQRKRHIPACKTSCLRYLS